MAREIGHWLTAGETGISSQALATCALTGTHDFKNRWMDDHPSDQPDLRRCVQLIEQVPAVAYALPIIARRSAVWAAYVANWPELTMLANMGDYQTTTDRMRELRAMAKPTAEAPQP